MCSSDLVDTFCGVQVKLTEADILSSLPETSVNYRPRRPPPFEEDSRHRMTGRHRVKDTASKVVIGMKISPEMKVRNLVFYAHSTSAVIPGQLELKVVME